jgi:hypothetical protein
MSNSATGHTYWCFYVWHIHHIHIKTSSLAFWKEIFRKKFVKVNLKNIGVKKSHPSNECTSRKHSRIKKCVGSAIKLDSGFEVGLSCFLPK